MRRLSLYALLLAAGCGGGPPDPTPTARAFWVAYQRADREALESLSVPGTADGVAAELEEDARGSVRFGPPLASPTLAAIPTTYRRDGDELEFETRCVFTDGAWKVDASRSFRERMRAEAEKENPMQALLMEAFGGSATGIREGLSLSSASEEAPRRAPPTPPSPAASPTELPSAESFALSALRVQLQQAHDVVAFPLTEVKLRVVGPDVPLRGLDGERTRIGLMTSPGDRVVVDSGGRGVLWADVYASPPLDPLPGHEMHVTVSAEGLPLPGSEQLRLRGVLALRVGGRTVERRAPLRLARGERVGLGAATLSVVGAEPQGAGSRIQLRLEGDRVALHELHFRRRGDGALVPLRELSRFRFGDATTLTWQLEEAVEEVDAVAWVLEGDGVIEIPLDLPVDLALRVASSP
ncbi:MAG: hypothetical protein AAGH15_11620 [Myxococcota bacterium]